MDNTKQEQHHQAKFDLLKESTILAIKPVVPIQQNPESQQTTDTKKNLNNDKVAQDIHPTIKLLRKRSENKRLASIIVSFCSGQSFDNIFKQVEQKSEQGTQILVYLCSSSYIQNILSAFRGEPVDDISRKLIEFINEVPPQNVVFNWQCSHGYANKRFSQGKDNVFNFLEIIIQKGYMAMFSDFSLKALINKWPQNFSLGPNPFVQKGSFDHRIIKLYFDKEALKNCPSAQLSAVAQISASGQCRIQILESTICFTVDQTKLKHQKYSVEILTIVPQLSIKQQHLRCKIGDKVGSAGHVLLSFPSKGKILASMGHWIQLIHIQTTQHDFFIALQTSLGTEQKSKLESYYSSLPDIQQKKQFIQKSSINFIKSQTPCISSIKKKIIQSENFSAP